MTPAGADGGVDVRCSTAVAQVKAKTAPTPREDVQKIYGCAVAEAKQAMFFSLAGYTAQSSAWATLCDIALFTFDLQGEPKPVNDAAVAVATRRHDLEPPDPPGKGSAPARDPAHPSGWVRAAWTVSVLYIAIAYVLVGLVTAAVPASRRHSRHYLQLAGVILWPFTWRFVPNDDPEPEDDVDRVVRRAATPIIVAGHVLGGVVLIVTVVGLPYLAWHTAIARAGLRPRAWSIVAAKPSDSGAVEELR